MTFRDRPGAILVDAFARVGAQPDKRTGLSHRGLIVTAPLDDLFLGVAKAEGYEEEDSRVCIGGGVDVLDLVLDGRGCWGKF